jgi:hypothetical protein
MIVIGILQQLSIHQVPVNQTTGAHFQSGRLGAQRKGPPQKKAALFKG